MREILFIPHWNEWVNVVTVYTGICQYIDPPPRYHKIVTVTGYASDFSNVLN